MDAMGGTMSPRSNGKLVITAEPRMCSKKKRKLNQGNNARWCGFLPSFSPTFAASSTLVGTKGKFTVNFFLTGCNPVLTSAQLLRQSRIFPLQWIFKLLSVPEAVNGFHPVFQSCQPATKQKEAATNSHFSCYKACSEHSALLVALD